MILPVLFAQISPSHENVSLDDERLQDDIPKGLHKVELDLDDALFLEFEEEKPSTPEKSPQPNTLPQQADPKPPPPQPLWKRSLPWLALLTLLVAVGATIWLFKPWTKLQDPNSLDPATTASPLSTQATAPTTSEPQSISYRRTFTFDLFVLEHAQNNQTYFLTHQIYIPGISIALVHEIEDKTIILRNEIYSHLQKIDSGQLAGSRDNKKLENDLLAVVNRSLKNGQVTEILVETRVVN